MNEWFFEQYNYILKDFSFYINLFRYLVYFIIGAFILLLLNVMKNLIKKIVKFCINIGSKQHLFLNLKKIAKLFLFIFTSLIIGIIILH